VAHPQVAAFARLANGAQAPTRRIYGQTSHLSRTMHDIRYNPVSDEIIVPNPFAGAILTFRGGANGQEAPIRVIQGPHTQLGGPQRLDIDVVHKELFVPGGGGILVYQLDANGDVPPKRILRGPDTQIGGNSLAVDPINNVLVVTGRDDSILVFDREASGNARSGGGQNLSWLPWRLLQRKNPSFFRARMHCRVSKFHSPIIKSPPAS